MTTAIIVDDMPNAIMGLKKDLASFCPEIEVIGTADGVVDGAKKLKTYKPDIVFLDIQMGDGTGFDLLEIITDINFKLIFTTASDEHALKAFKYAAIDYLLKPIEPESLQKAVKRAQALLTPTSTDRIDILKGVLKNEDQGIDKIALHTQEQIKVVKISDILHCTSDNNNTIFHFKEGKKLFVTKTLKHFEQLLENKNFVRVHQSHLVNSAYIEAYIKSEGGYLLLKNGQHIPVSVRKKSMVMELLDNM